MILKIHVEGERGAGKSKILDLITPVLLTNGYAVSGRAFSFINGGRETVEVEYDDTKRGK